MTVTRAGMLVHGYYPSDPRVRREAEALAAAGYEVHVFCLRQGGGSGGAAERPQECVNGVQVHRLPLARRRGGHWRYAFEYSALTVLGAAGLLALHLRRSLGVVHVHNMPDFLIVTGLIPRLFGAKLILDVHDPTAELFGTKNSYRWVRRILLKLLQWQEQISWRMADRIITVSQTMRDNLVKKHVSAEKVSVVHNFPDAKYFPRIDRTMIDWPVRRDRLVLLYTGTVTEHYRLDVALRAVAGLSASLPRVELQILGEGNQVRAIRRLAQDLKISDRVEIKPPVGPEGVRRVMSRADMGISSHGAGAFGDLYFSLKVLEYMSQGLPVVVSRTLTLQRYIPDDAVFYFEPGNWQEMAEQVERAWKNPALTQGKIRYALDLASQYSWELEKGHLVSIYQGL